MKRTLIRWSLALVLAGLALPLHRGAAQEAPPEPVAAPTEFAPRPTNGLSAVQAARREAAHTLRQKMQTRVNEKFADTPLNEALDRLSAIGKLPIYVELASLAEDGIPPDEPINASLQDVTIEQSLNRILKPLGLTWLIEDEVVKVTTYTKARETFETRIYNVQRLQDLVRRKYPTAVSGDQPQPRPPAVMGPAQFGGGFGGMPRGTSAGGFGGSSQTFGVDELCRQLAGAEAFHPNWILLPLFDQTSGEWEVIDGFGGTVSRMNGLLVVRQTLAVHEEVASLLEALERVAAGDPRMPIIAVRPPTYPHARDEAVVAALARPMDRKYIDTPLSEVLADIGKTFGITVLLDSQALAEEGIPTDEPIMGTFDGITLASALKIMLPPLGLTFYPSEGALVITTRTKANGRFFTAVYDIADLAAAGYAGRSLLDTIAETTGAEWEQRVGFGGALSEPFPGALVVRQTWRGQNEVARLLEGIRETLAKSKPAPDAAAVPGPPADPQAVVTRFYPVGDPKRAVALQEAIMDFIAPGRWGDDEARKIHVVGNTLVVRQPGPIQEQVRDFLDQLEAAENKTRDLPSPQGFHGGMGGFSGGMGGGGGFF